MPEKRQRGRSRAFHDNTDQNTLQSLDRAMMILEELARSGGRTLSDLAGALDQSPATVYRVLTTLEHRRIVELVICAPPGMKFKGAEMKYLLKKAVKEGKITKEQAKERQRRQLEMLQAFMQDAVRQYKEKNVNVHIATPEELAVFSKKMVPVYDWWMGKVPEGKKYIEFVRANQ